MIIATRIVLMFLGLAAVIAALIAASNNDWLQAIFWILCDISVTIPAVDLRRYSEGK